MKCQFDILCYVKENMEKLLNIFHPSKNINEAAFFYENVADLLLEFGDNKVSVEEDSSEDSNDDSDNDLQIVDTMVAIFDTGGLPVEKRVVFRTSIDGFSSIFNDKVYRAIVKYLNQVAKALGCKLTDVAEVKKHIGITILLAVLKMNQIKASTLWDPKYGPPIFQKVTTKQRYQTLNKLFLGLNELEAINEILNTVTKNFRYNYYPGEILTIEQQIINQELTVYWICDPKYSYPLNGIIEVENKNEIVKRLTKPFFHSQKTVILPPELVNFDIAKFLFANGLKCVGRVNENQSFIPSEFLNRSKSVLGTVHDNVVLVSSYVNDDLWLFITTCGMNETEIVQIYNEGQCVPLDMNIRPYSTKRFKKLFVLSMFYNLVDVSGFVGSVLCRDLKLKRKDFLLSVAESLIGVAEDQRQ